ncbi:hypothetical protein [Baaleninema sp.]|uniref:hypothetical protein n=1 Tax=Baaleninema sp. TaxID=3101197 RepID=UPI003D03FAA6
MTDFFEASQWRERIRQRKTSIELPAGFPEDDDLRETYCLARALDEDLVRYFQQVDLSIDSRQIQRGIRDICDSFESEVLQGLQQEKAEFRQNLKLTQSKFKNIFEFAGLENLYLSNNYTRFISENLGHKIEDIAALSPYVFIPESRLGITLKGIDCIIFGEGQLYYTQIKTKKDTLTGSQVSRSINELKIHPYSMFVAALDMGSSLSLSRKKADKNGIKVLIGEEFWSEIGICYSEVLNEFSSSLKYIEERLYLK